MLSWIHHRRLRTKKRAIGIDITPHCIRALQITEQAGQLTIEKVFSAPTQRHSDAPSSVLQQLTEHGGFDWHAEVAIAMPHNAVFYREVETDSSISEPLQQTDMSGLDNNFPIPPDQIIAQTCNEQEQADGASSQLVAATDRDSVQERLDRLSGLQIAPNLVESEIFAVRAAALANYPSMRLGRYVIVYVDQSHLSLLVLEDSKVLVVRNTPITVRTKRQADISREQKEAEFISHEVRMTWQRIFEDGIDNNTEVVIATEHSFSKGLVAFVEGELRCPTKRLEPCGRIQYLPGVEVGCEMVIAEGLAIRMLAPDRVAGVNFLEGRQGEHDAPVNLRKEASFCGALLLAILTVWIIGLVTELSSLESQYSSVKADIKQTFRQLAPEENNIVNPVVQLTQRIEALEQEQLRFSQYRLGNSPLTVLHGLSTSRPPSSHIRLNNLLVAGESVSVQATCSSFDEPYQWQRELERTSEFTGIEIQNPQRDSKTEEIEFKIILKAEKGITL
jgi:hypothetical protein